MARSGSHPAFPLSPLVRLPPFWVRWRGPHGFPPFPSLLFVPELPKTDSEAGGGQSALEGLRVGNEASRGRPGTGVREVLGRRARSRWKWRRLGLASRRGLPSSAVSAGLPGLAGLRVTSDADSQDERGWSWGRKANGDEGAQLPNPGQRRQTASFVIPPPAGEGF